MYRTVSTEALAAARGVQAHTLRQRQAQNGT